MVICKYFLNGNCRFGTKCANEHLDVKQLLKSDVESAVNGNQWPLSCFGPFKEKPCIPNFIEDQSFEEIRMLCYGSKKQNFFDNFNQQFTKEVIEAKNKMKMLLSLNKEVIDVVLSLYNSSEPPKGTAQTNTNPFGLGAGPNAQQNGNLFGNSTTAQIPSSMFGGSNNAASGGGIFGGAQKTILGQSAFGSFPGQQQTQQQQQGSGIFGPVQPQQQQPQQQQVPQTNNTFGGNIFAQAAQQTPAVGGSIFGTRQQQQQQPQQPQAFGGNSSSVFSQQSNSGNIFAQAAQQNNQQSTVGGNIFAQAAQSTQPPAFGLFPQAPQPQQQPQQQAPPAFGAQMTQQSPFGAVQPHEQRAFFGQTQPIQQQQQQPQNTGNIFASQVQPQQQQYPQQQQAPGIFAAAATNIPFGTAQLPQQQQANIFAQAIGSYPQQQQQSMANDRTYSKMENLTPEEIAAFKADTFELGKIPFSPPPRELVN